LTNQQAHCSYVTQLTAVSSSFLARGTQLGTGNTKASEKIDKSLGGFALRPSDTPFSMFTPYGQHPFNGKGLLLQAIKKRSCEKKSKMALNLGHLI